MSTNAYHAHETIEYGGIGPSAFYGYYVSWSGDNASVHHFDTCEERDMWERVIAAAGRFTEEDSYIAWMAAALLLMEYMGDEGDQASANMTLNDLLMEDEGATDETLERLREAAAAFLYESRDEGEASHG